MCASSFWNGHKWFKHSFVSLPKSQFQKWLAIKYIWHKSRSVLIANVMKPNHSSANPMNISIWNAQLVEFERKSAVSERWCDIRCIWYMWNIWVFSVVFDYHSHLNSLQRLGSLFNRSPCLSLTPYVSGQSNTLDTVLEYWISFVSANDCIFGQNVNHTTIHLVKITEFEFLI